MRLFDKMALNAICPVHVTEKFMWKNERNAQQSPMPVVI